VIIFKNNNFDRMILQQFAKTHPMRDKILDLMVQHELKDDCYVEML